MANLKVPELLPVSPISIACPFCSSKPGQDSATRAGGFSVIHVARSKPLLSRMRPTSANGKIETKPLRGREISQGIGI